MNVNRDSAAVPTAETERSAPDADAPASATASAPASAPASASVSAPPDAQGATAAREDLRDRLRNLTLRQQRFERYLSRRLHVDPAGLAVMDHLVNVGPATPTELARRLEASTAATTLIVDRLVAGGHATRQPHPTDRRKVIVTPAEDWGATAYTYVAPIVHGVTEAAAALTPQERSTVVAFLDRVIDAYDHATKP
ncbi:MarR family transcriptional regulator [Streptomyces sp. SID3343]|uniref:MarR family winged helix-turn-helix transcriptional regulator n=1 Tax=Streptomyces sp. SID3343 TaxID=2690260 RepID=UPI00136EB621|nr:MarR family transcriptional regulator [Streptomyces sp. SID3343]MYW05887.1 MarR family transcriptional regulator [Streptomyces sp. SID3343]